MKKYFKIYTQKVCSILLNDGFPLQSVEPDRKHVGYNVFLFNDSEQLRVRVKEIQDELRREKENI